MKTVEEELRNFIIAHRGGLTLAPDDGVRQDPAGAGPDFYAGRNAELILDHFGMGGLFWPTLQELADAYDGLETRERARQIIARNYTEHLVGRPLSAAKAVADALQGRPFWTESEFLDVLQRAGLATEIEYAKPVIKYLKTQALASNYDVYLPDTRAATRDNYRDHDERVIIAKPAQEQLRRLFDSARRRVGLNGLCRMSHVEQAGESELSNQFQVLLKLHGDVVCVEQDGDLWFAFDDRDNTLVSYAGKIFRLVDACSIQNLSQLLANALASRASRFKEYPDASVIGQWIKHSRHFRVSGESVSFAGASTDVTKIEDDTVEMMRGRGAFSSPELRSVLSSRGHGDAYISKQIFHSPLIFVDRSQGRKNYRFTLVTDLLDHVENADSVADTGKDTSEADRYDAFKKALQNLEVLDVPASTKARGEQRVLRAWLFGERSHAICAICGREFATASLVTAHKKKRSKCTSTEKRDPYIVFPLCNLGCDYLYEHGYLTVSRGGIVAGIEAPGEAELAAVQVLLGTRIDERWTRGPVSFFDNLPSY
ncbi:hypothetical protein [Maricaulis sp.]|uniref:hypothetical protein n=1 Tax=Maricaulis sp. TaxID=1486257 RepID=UPI003A8D7DD3